MSCVCVSRTAEFGTSDLFLPSIFWALRDERRICANEEVSIFLSREKKANVLE